MAAGASTDAAGFKERYALIRLHVPQPSCRGQAGKTAANDGEIDRVWHRN
jgi:hypothetical protein